MNGGGPVIVLSLFTLLAGLVVVGASFMYFLRLRRNRRIAADALVGRDGDHGSDTSDGALPDLLALLVLSLVVMALLSIGYISR